MASQSGLRLLIYDRTCAGRGPLPGLSTIWGAGQHLYRGLGRLDASRGVASWAEGLAWLAEFQAPRPIAEIQFWGHGRFGKALVGREALDAAALVPGHRHHPVLAQISARMQKGNEGLWWFRTCETFGTAAGQTFARAWADFFGCRAAGHTHAIGVWQSGLHTLLPGEPPSWNETEGVEHGDAAARHKSLASRPGRPNTVSFLHGRVPRGF